MQGVLAGIVLISGEEAVMSLKSKILLPLDVDTADQAVDLVKLLSNDVAGFKVGLELINAAGFGIFDRIREAAGPHVPIFYDCKLHDIPNTVAGAVRAITKRGVWMFNVHASGGSQMMRAAVNGAAEASSDFVRPIVLAVTVLTSISSEIAHEELGIDRDLSEHVVSLARLAQDSGCDGVVASPREAEAIRRACGDKFVLVIPGVRPAGSDANDQKRVMSPSEAVRAGANYIVVGRPITASADPLASARSINEEIVRLDATQG